MLSVIIMFKATVVFVSCCCNTIPWQGHESSEEFLKCTREYMGILRIPVWSKESVRSRGV